MCCSLSIFPVDPAVAEAILKLGMFETSAPVSVMPGAPLLWEREVTEDDGTVTTVRGQVVGERLNLSLVPTISAMEHHRRVSGGVYLEIACKVAEKCGSAIVQSSNIGECIENGSRQKLLADYGAGQHLDWAAVCVGFQRAIGTT